MSEITNGESCWLFFVVQTGCPLGRASKMIVFNRQKEIQPRRQI